MPWRDPELWQSWMAPLVASAIAVLRVLYDGKETKWTRIMLESAICGLLTLAASKGISATGLNLDWSIVAGGMIGLMGSEFVRFTAKRIVQIRTGSK